MDPDDVTFGSEASRFIRQYEKREDALRYARAHAAVEWQDDDITVAIGHDPDGNRYRFSCVTGDETHVLTFRPIE